MEKNRHILVVDDEPEALNGYEQFLKPEDSGSSRKSSRVKSSDTSASTQNSEEFEIHLCASGEEAVDTVQNLLIDGIQIAAGFFDVKLKGKLDGLQTIQKIKGMDGHIHCVVVTAYHDRSVEEISTMFGEDFNEQWDYLNKPFTRGEILQKARQMVAAWNRKFELELVNSQLKRAERLAGIGQLARGVGHEFGNILLRIVGKTDLALLEQDPAKVKKHLEVVMSASERAGNIVKSLMSFSKAEPKFSAAPARGPVDQSFTLVNHELSTANIEMETVAPEDIPDVIIDMASLGQVFLNLLINSKYAMKESGGKITVTLSEQLAGPRGKSKGVLYTIRDTGTGIPADVLPNIFDFNFTTKGDEGSGVGLALSKQIVEAHGGSIEVSSKEGDGTEFQIWIPAAP